ncbi:protein transport protein SEC23 [Chloropicon primus]|uniref:Protein transport protein SEC23 n=1 Tax=Chloropicon primus TaxID=1764295 RepID=A0A5B8MUC8_9CHLO|nr:hypothetical protein A3770_12p64950 [Chloropicon primus]UPR03188.1 protein transport protein SEC23 [Chloropicon primus]|eukprot:QDZ23977.1 hypothetical protein A3770_12p64950 [Chloropicon primus]
MTVRHVRACASKVPRDAAVGNTCKVPLGAIVSPFLSNKKTPMPMMPWQGKRLGSGVRCVRCRAMASRYCHVAEDRVTWRCALCGQQNKVKEADASRLLLMQTNHDNGDDEENHGSVSVMEWVSDASVSVKVRRTLVLLIDVTLDADHFEMLRVGLLDFLGKVLGNKDGPSRLAMASFGSVATLYHLGEEEGGEEATTSSVVEGDAFPVSLQGCIGGEEGQRGLAVATLEANLQRYFLEVNRTEGGGVSSGERERVLRRVERTLRAISPFSSRRNTPNHERPRCLVGSLSLVSKAIKMCEWSLDDGQQGGLGGSNQNLTSIMVVGGGNCTKGPGSIPSEDHPKFIHLEREALSFIEELAEFLTERSVVVDIFGAGHVSLDVPCLYPLTQNTGGCLMMYETFGKDLFAALESAYNRFIGTSAVMDFHLSADHFNVDQIVGPIKPVSAKNRRRAIAEGNGGSSGGGGSLLSDNAVELTSVEYDHGITLSLSMRADIPGDSTFFQVEVWYASLDGCWRHRVITSRISVTSSGREFILSVDPLAVGVTLAKKAMVDIRKAKYSRKVVDGVKKDLADRIYDIARNFSPKVRGDSGGIVARFFSKPTCLLKEELAILAEFVYHLGRTVAFTENAHRDEKTCFVAHFLRCGVESCARMVWPRCLTLGPQGPVALPAADIALQMEQHFLMDCGLDCFVWVKSNSAVGSTAVGDRERSILAKYNEYMWHFMLRGRFPAPEMHLCMEGTGNARYLQSRLIPTRQDTPEEQADQVRGLGSLEPGLRNAHITSLVSSFHCTDEPSFREWCRQTSLSCGSQALGIL